MKKTLLSVVAIGAVGGAVAGLIFLRQPSGETGPRAAADLLPPEAIALLELPDLKGSGERWKATSLYKIGQEPDMKAFLERPLSLIPKSAELDEARLICRQVDAKQFFVALASLENNDPKGVAGLRYNGTPEGQQALKGLVAKAVKKAQATSPAGKSALEQYNGFEIESFADDDTTLAGVFAGEWYFLANDIALLKATLDRLTGATEAPALTTLEGYKKTVSQLPSTAEARLFVNFPTVSERLIALMTMSGQSMKEEQMEEFRKVKGFAAATTFDGELIRDTGFMYSPGLRQQPKLTGSLDALSAAGLPIFAAFAPDWAQFSLPEGSTIPGALGAVIGRLHREGIDGKTMAAAFGSEGSFSMDLTAAIGVPANLFALEVKDRAEAEKVVRLIVEGWAKREEGGVTYWTSDPIPAGMLSFNYTLALTDKLLLGTFEMGNGQGISIQQALARQASGAEALTATESYKKAIATVKPPGQSVVYVDGKVIFERIYGMLRPMAMMYAGAAPQVSTYVDIAKLPATETISKHLHPMVLSQGMVEDGVFFESTGTVTFYQGIGVLGGIFGVAAQVAGPLMNQGGSGADAGSAPDAGSPEAAPETSPEDSDQENP